MKRCWSGLRSCASSTSTWRNRHRTVVGELRLALERLDRAAHQVVEVDHLAARLLLPVRGRARRPPCRRRPAGCDRRGAPRPRTGRRRAAGPSPSSSRPAAASRSTPWYSSFGTDLSRRRRRSAATVHGRWSRSRHRCCSSASATEWNVPAVHRPCRPSRGSRRRSSPAASRVNVSTTVWASSAVPAATRYATRRVSTRVLPEPAPAITATSIDSVVTAWRCSSSRSASRVRGSTRPRYPPGRDPRCGRRTAAFAYCSHHAVPEEAAQRLRDGGARPASALVVVRRARLRARRFRDHRHRVVLRRRRSPHGAAVRGGRRRSWCRRSGWSPATSSGPPPTSSSPATASSSAAA